jgi:hypothetical protein
MELPARLAQVNISEANDTARHATEASLGSDGSLGDEPETLQQQQQQQQDSKQDGTAGEEEHERCVLEDFTQCSESHLWKLMMSFYDRKGVESWSQGIVPHFITCNSFIGRSYAHVLCGFLRDCMSAKSTMPLDQNEPLYIIELGTGSGKFSFFMLKVRLSANRVITTAACMRSCC